MATALVLGGGFGGVATAIALRELLADSDQVVLVDRRPDFVMGLRKTWHLLGSRSLADGSRQLALLEARGISVRHAEVEGLDPALRRVVLDGKATHADAVVVALGAALAPGAVPGLREAAVIAWEPDAADAGRAAIVPSPSAAQVGRWWFGTPYSCPPAPYELALTRARSRHAGKGCTPSATARPCRSATDWRCRRRACWPSCRARRSRAASRPPSAAISRRPSSRGSAAAWSRWAAARPP
ncbi:MAG: hypothetical protein DLM71_09190 [Chloroflexi bacterium]|nr:MAG: hypothetical protein DLM71_09190 [Chloroflexota bacterium]